MKKDKKKVVAIVQARMGSTRLPGKSLRVLAGKPVIERVIDRAKLIPLVDEVWLATTDKGEDDKLAAWANKNNIPVFRGSADDVLDRYYQTAHKADADVVMRVTGDCPLLDPSVSNLIVTELLSGNFDYVTNTMQCTYPDGFDTEVMNLEALARAWKEAKLASEREHVTPYIWKQPELFKLKNVKNDRDYSSIRLTLDTPEDAEFLERVITTCEELGSSDLESIIGIIESHPEWSEINSAFARNEGYAKSIREDRVIKK
jgi:spore coat polysaccharide biosynthesis protein SpsF